MPQLFVFGDSITWGAWDPDGGGWVQRLRRDIDLYQVTNRDFWCPVYNLGISGDTANGVAERFTRELQARRAAAEETIVLIAIGTNDSIVDLQNSSNTLPVETYKTHLNMILEKARPLSKKVAFIGLPPVNQDLLDPIPWDLTKAYRLDRVQQFNQACQQFCAEHTLPFLSLWDSWIRSGYQNMLSDGAHPNTAGHEQIHRSVKQFLIETRFLVEPFRSLTT